MAKIVLRLTFAFASVAQRRQITLGLNWNIAALSILLYFAFSFLHVSRFLKMGIKNNLYKGFSQINFYGKMQSHFCHFSLLIWVKKFPIVHFSLLKIGRASCRERVCQYV